MPNHVTNQIEFYGNQKNINKVFELIKGDNGYIDFNKIIPMPKTLNLTAGGYQNEAIIYALSKKPIAEKLKIESTLKNKKVDFYGNYFNKIFNCNFNATELEKRANQFEEQLKGNEKDIFDSIDYEGLGIETFEDLGNTYINNIIKYGHDTWYEWSCEHWGTKWNAYDIYFDANNNVITFDTAWSCPLSVLNKLAEICYRYKVSFTGKWADEDCGCNVGIFESDCDRDEYWFAYEYIDDCSNEAYDIYVELKGESECMGKDNDGNWVCFSCECCPNKDHC